MQNENISLESKLFCFVVLPFLICTRYIEFDVASQIARGDIDPTTLKPMIDILPSYQPRSKDTPLRVLDSNRPQNRSVAAQASILQYFRRLIIQFIRFFIC